MPLWNLKFRIAQAVRVTLSDPVEGKRAIVDAPLPSRTVYLIQPYSTSFSAKPV
jgi:hypothetical protein